jgi:ATP-binding cassette subfamily B protein
VSGSSQVSRILRARAPQLALLVPLTLAEVAFDGALTLSYRFLVDDVVQSASARGTMLVPVAVALGVGFVVAAVLSTWRDYLYARESTAILTDLRTKIFDHCQRLSMRFFESRSSGDVLARFSTDLAGLETALASGVSGLLLPALHVIVGTSLLFFVLDWKLALLGAALWPIVLIGPRLVAPRAARASYEKKTHEATLLATIDETLRGRRIVKALGLESVTRGWVVRDAALLSRTATRAGFLGALVERTTVLTIYALQVFVVIAGAVMAYRGSITVGVLVSFVTIFWNLGWSLVVLGRATPLVVSAAGSAKRIDELLVEPPDPCEGGAATSLAELTRSIRFEQVTFAYDKRIALLNVSFEIKRGEHVAFVGPSGSGKSTVMNLLSRFEDPREGKVTFDGVDIRTVPSSKLRERLGFVLQDSFLFDTSIRENVRLGRAGASDEQIESAARAAEIHAIVTAMPDGYDTVVGERGGRLSGGQRQRVAVARALVRDPRILLLDEATSALDPTSEAAINETLEKARDGRTTISITHRLSTTTHADRIFVLVDGRLVQQGTHPELLAKGGVYGELWKKQQGFVVAEDGLSAEVTVARLRDIALLAPLAEEQLEKLSRRFTCERVSAGQTIITEGAAGTLFYVIVRGTVRVEQTLASGKVGNLGRLSDGDQFGELALLNASPRTATIVAVTDCLLLTLKRPHFLELLDETPGLRATVEAIAAERVARVADTNSAKTLC